MIILRMIFYQVMDNLSTGVSCPEFQLPYRQALQHDELECAVIAVLTSTDAYKVVEMLLDFQQFMDHLHDALCALCRYNTKMAATKN